MNQNIIQQCGLYDVVQVFMFSDFLIEFLDPLTETLLRNQRLNDTSTINMLFQFLLIFCYVS